MVQRDYEIVLSPDLNINSTDFATAWNALVEAKDIGEAHVATAKGKLFDPTLLATVIISVSTGVASNVISDLIMKVLEKHVKHGKHTHIEHVKKPDGTESYVADIDEE